MLRGTLMYRSASCAGAEGTGARTASCHPPPGSDNDLGDPPCPLTMLAPRISGRAAVPSSVSNLSPRRLFGQAREPDRRAEEALGDTLLLAPEAEGKPGLTHPRGASPRARSGPRMWGADTDAAPERPEPRPGSGVQRGDPPVPRSLACSRSADPDPAEAPERALPGCCCSSSSSGPRPPLPVSFQNQLPNWRAGVGRSRLCSSPPLSQWRGMVDVSQASQEEGLDHRPLPSGAQRCRE
ncbi:uncharacterized protein LOC114683047 [Peromyscus leucopus]|uniref:uncharacterized protein LOC114683047 n=1 Tax=Peromyscus leucopus TaxID=10041 RepID=UPI00188574F8|nr:uncharacterized protein LOC114683047 [Peromyscus leucopus]